MSSTGVMQDYDAFNERSTGENLVINRPPVESMKTFLNVKTNSIVHIFSDVHFDQLVGHRDEQNRPVWLHMSNVVFIAIDAVLSNEFISGALVGNSTTLKHK
jgi:hypothetical protein